MCVCVCVNDFVGEEAVPQGNLEMELVMGLVTTENEARHTSAHPAHPRSTRTPSRRHQARPLHPHRRMKNHFSSAYLSAVMCSGKHKYRIDVHILHAHPHHRRYPNAHSICRQAACIHCDPLSALPYAPHSRCLLLWHLARDWDYWGYGGF